VRIALFSERVRDDFRQAIQKLTEQSMRGLVLDLRFNPGGVVDEAVAVADGLLDDGVIVSTRSRHDREVFVARASREKTLTRVPTVVLVNQGTASAAEIVAGALQDHGRAALVGVKTFGKGVVCKDFPLPDESSLVLTVAKYYTPKGRSIEGKGLEPDVAEPAAATPALPDEDAALARAMDVLRKRL
jgi:carboxyl-terminal processing protease